jgi:hypothetical protein
MVFLPGAYDMVVDGLCVPLPALGFANELSKEIFSRLPDFINEFNATNFGY